jgi:hypothetical protein
MKGNNNMRKRIFRNTATASAVFIALATAGTAQANNFDETQQQMNEMSLRYGSLSGAMTESFAAKQGQSLKSFLLAKPGTLANLSGVRSEDVTLLVGQLGANATAADLDAAMQSNGLAFSSLAYRSVDDAVKQIQATSGSYDAAVVQAGMQWAQALTKLHAPQLVTPSAPRLDGSQVTGMPAEGLAFGMFTNRALNSFVRQFPDVFGQVNSNGIGSAADQIAWNKAISTAMDAAKPDLTSMLPSKCGAAFLDGLAGKSSSTGCGSCSAAGLLANGQLQLIFDPSSGSTLQNPSNPAVTPSEWENLTPAQREAITKQNPTLASALGSGSKSTTSCTNLNSAVKSNVDSVLPKVIDFLKP